MTKRSTNKTLNKKSGNTIINTSAIAPMNKPRIVMSHGTSFVYVTNSTGDRIKNLYYTFLSPGSQGQKPISVKLASTLAIDEVCTFELIDKAIFPVEARIDYTLAGKKVSSPTDVVIYPGRYIREHIINVPAKYDPNTIYDYDITSALPHSTSRILRPTHDVQFGVMADFLRGYRQGGVNDSGSAAFPLNASIPSAWCFDVIMIEEVSDLTFLAVTDDGTKQKLETKSTFFGSRDHDAVCLFSFPVGGARVKTLTVQWKFKGKDFQVTGTDPTSFVFAALLIVGDEGGFIWWGSSPTRLGNI